MDCPGLTAVGCWARIDISSSQNVVVENSEVKPGDDCVVVYALHPNEMVTRNITIRNT